MTSDAYRTEFDKVERFARRRWDSHAKRGDLTPVPAAFLNVGICLGVMLEGRETVAAGLEALARDLRAGALDIEKRK